MDVISVVNTSLKCLAFKAQPNRMRNIHITKSSIVVLYCRFKHLFIKTVRLL